MLQSRMMPLIISLLLSAAPAGAAPPTDPPPPPAENLTEDKLRAWATLYVEPGNYVVGAYDLKRVILYDPTSLTRQADGHVIALVRSELYRPRTVHGQTLRSDIKKIEIDCDNFRYRIIEIKGFAASNVQQEVKLEPLSGDWTEPQTEDSSSGMTLRRACGDLRVRR